MSINANVERAKTDYDRAYEAGKQEKNFSLMTAIQQGGERVSYADAFSTPYWTDDSFNPIYDMRITNGIRMFKQSLITDLRGILERQGVVLDTSGTANIYEFMSGSAITRVPIIDASLCPTLTQTFYNCRNLVSIEKLILSSDGVTSFVNTFYNGKELVHLVIDGVIGANSVKIQWSTKLSHDSLVSIINALADKSGDTSGTTWTLTLGSENLAKLTLEEQLIAEQKGWDLV